MFRPILFLLLLAPSLWGVEVKVPDSIRMPPGRLRKVEATSDSKTPIKWVNTSEDLDMIADSSGKYVIVTSTVPGTYKIAAYTADEKGATEPVYCTIVVTGPPAPPVPPVPPIPPTPPQPPAPPVPSTGPLKVAFIVETADAAKVPPGQLAVIYADKVRSYLRAKAEKGADGKTRAWRVIDKDADVSTGDPFFKESLAKKRDSLPWVIITNGKDGYEGPLPASADAALELLKKYGGA